MQLLRRSASQQSRVQRRRRSLPRQRPPLAQPQLGSRLLRRVQVQAQLHLPVRPMPGERRHRLQCRRRGLLCPRSCTRRSRGRRRLLSRRRLRPRPHEALRSGESASGEQGAAFLMLLTP